MGSFQKNNGLRDKKLSIYFLLSIDLFTLPFGKIRKCLSNIMFEYFMPECSAHIIKGENLPTPPPPPSPEVWDGEEDTRFCLSQIATIGLVVFI